FGFLPLVALAQVKQQVQTSNQKFKKASGKVQMGLKKGDRDTLAQGYFDLAESFYQKGDLTRSEAYYKQAKTLYMRMDDAEGIAKSSRALARVQEDLNKNQEALSNYKTARDNTLRTGDINANALNGNDIQ